MLLFQRTAAIWGAVLTTWNYAVMKIYRHLA